MSANEMHAMLERLAAVDAPVANTIADRVREIQTPDHQSGREGEQASMVVDAFAMIDRFGAEFDDEDLPELMYHVRGKDDDVDQEDFEKVNPATYKDIFESPMSFDDAWNHEEPFQKKMWQKAITLEFDKMKERDVWRKIKRSMKPDDRRCVKHKWVFEIKRDGRFRARLVACGYSQVAGVDFQEIFSPVVNDITFRILLIYLMMYEKSSLIFDVETAFLLGDLDEEIYMDCPKGMDHEDDECLLLKKTIYGLVQSARQYFKKFSDVLVTKMGFRQCASDPCMFMRENKNGVVIILCYVDDNLTIGDQVAIDEMLVEIQKHGFSITIDHELTDYLSCEIKFSKDGTKAWLGQPHMVKKIRKTFGEEVKGLQKYRTPGTPGQGLVRVTDDADKVSVELQSRYRTGCGMLLYMIKHSRPDMVNAVRELTKCLDGCSQASYKEMLRVIKYLLDTPEKGLKIFPLKGKANWLLVLYSDSDWAGDKDSRKSVGGYMLFLNGVLVCWRSKSQKVVALSSSEAEFYACSEAVKEVPFIVQILLFVGIPVELPVDVWVDNIGAIFMAENSTSSSRTRHMDTRYRFVEQLQKDDLIKVKFVPTKLNLADGATKNVTGEIQDGHMGSYLVDKKDVV